MENSIPIQMLPIAAADVQTPDPARNDVFGQMLLAQSRLLDALARRDRSKSANEISVDNDDVC